MAAASVVERAPRAFGHAVARRTEPTFAPVVTGTDAPRRMKVLHAGSAPAQLSLWLRPLGARTVR